jgi:hypothetical protein
LVEKQKVILISPADAKNRSKGSIIVSFGITGRYSEAAFHAFGSDMLFDNHASVTR